MAEITGKKKRRHLGLIILAIVLIVVVGLIATGITAAREAMNEISAMHIKTYTVSRGTVDETVNGSGQVEAVDTVDVTVPAGVQVTSVLVSSGDQVKQGQKLAELSTDSITDCLVEIESSLQEIDDERKADQDRTQDDEDKLSDLQLEQLDNEEAALQDAQTKLNALKTDPYITASTDGIIGDVNVTEGGTTAATDGSTSTSSAISSLSSDASAYLSGAAGTTSSAVVEGTAAASTAAVKRITAVSGRQTGQAYASAVPVSEENGDGETADGDTADAADTDSGSGTADSTDTVSGSGTADGTDTDSGTTDPAETDTGTAQKITDWQVLTSRMPAPKAGDQPVTAAQLFGDVEGTPFMEACHYTGTISWMEVSSDGTESSVSSFSNGKAYTAVLTLTADGAYVFSADSVPSGSDFAGALADKVAVQISGDGKTMVIIVPYLLSDGSSSSEDTEEDGQNETENGSGSSLQDLSGLTDEQLSALQEQLANASSGLSGSAYSSLNGGSSLYSLSGTDASALADASGSSASISYSPYDCIAFTIRKTDRLQIQVNIDEQDVLLLSEGQKTDVKLDALEDQTFEGTVSEIGADAVQSTGSAKYPVTVELDGVEEVRFGMSAEVTIHVDEAADVLVIPMEALQQEGSTLFVYTEQEEDGTLGGKTTVQTGLSDGENVEITSGLQEGDTIYYSSTEGDDSFSSPFATSEQGPEE